MNTINKRFIFKRDKQREKQAIESIKSLLASEDSKNMNEAEIMALILETIAEAHRAEPRQDNDEDSQELREFSSVVNHYAKQFREQGAIIIKNGGKDLNSCIVTLNKIRLLMKNEAGDWMDNRMSLFINGLTIAEERREK